jgi:ribosomal protein L44E
VRKVVASCDHYNLCKVHVVSEEWKDSLGFGISKPDVVLKHFGSVGRQHESSEKKANKRITLM